MSLSGTKCTRLILIFCNVIFSWVRLTFQIKSNFWKAILVKIKCIFLSYPKISGGLLVLFGGASLYDPSYIQMYTLLTLDSVPQYVFILFSLSIVGLGGFIITLGLFGCFGTLCDNNCIIKTVKFVLLFLLKKHCSLLILAILQYVYLLIFVFVAEVGLAAGSLYIYFTFPSAAPELRESLVEKIKTDFGYPTQLTFNTAVDFTQNQVFQILPNNEYFGQYLYKF